MRGKPRQIQKGLMGGVVDRDGHSHVNYGTDNKLPFRIKFQKAADVNLERVRESNAFTPTLGDIINL